MSADERVVLPLAGVLVGPDRYHRGGLAVRGSVIDGLEPSSREADPALIGVAGLRNAHVHLDLSDVTGVSRAAGRGFGRWVLDLLQRRGPFDAERLARAAARGVEEVLATGTTSVGDIDSSGAAASVVASSGLKGVAFRELLGSRVDEVSAAGEEWIASFDERSRGSRLRPGISPHAPYSTPPELYRRCRDIADRHRVPLTTHIAETRDEARFLDRGDGEFRDLLATLQVAPPFPRAPRQRPIEYLSKLGVLPGALLAHVNYPSGDDVGAIKESGATVVYCPRSHAFFGHSRHPVAELIERGGAGRARHRLAGEQRLAVDARRDRLPARGASGPDARDAVGHGDVRRCEGARGQVGSPRSRRAGRPRSPEL